MSRVEFAVEKDRDEAETSVGASNHGKELELCNGLTHGWEECCFLKIAKISKRQRLHVGYRHGISP